MCGRQYFKYFMQDLFFPHKKRLYMYMYIVSHMRMYWYIFVSCITLYIYVDIYLICFPVFKMVSVQQHQHFMCISIQYLYDFKIHLIFRDDCTHRGCWNTHLLMHLTIHDCLQRFNILRLILNITVYSCPVDMMHGN